LAYAHVVAQVGFGARPVGSQALERTGEYIEAYLVAQGWETWREEADFRGTPIRNILAQKDVSADERPVIMLGAHYDTRPHADRDPDPGNRTKPILGANDGASGVAVLLELARVYDPERSGFDVVLAFFDGEDKGNIDGWPFSVGAEAVADQWAGSIDSMIVVDMVGDADQQLYYEGTSDPALAREIWSVAGRLGYSEWFLPEVRYSLMDDHAPFLRRGVPAVVIIDFDYPHWHTLADTVDKVSALSLERVGRVLMEYLYTQ
jgi:Zn-dependent M28 family amino/carboxypeptidase